METAETKPLIQRGLVSVRRRLPPLRRHTLRWGWFYLSIILGLAAGEDYFPFSDWPMYSNFANTATYVYAVDGHGNQIPWRTTFGQTSAQSKKQFESEMKRIQRDQAIERQAAAVLAGEAFMGRLARRLSADELEQMGGSLTLHFMGIAFNENYQMEHRRVASPVIELESIISAKRAGEAGEARDAQKGGEGTGSDEAVKPAPPAPTSAGCQFHSSLEEMA